jgi:hypothetical protein
MRFVSCELTEGVFAKRIVGFQPLGDQLDGSSIVVEPVDIESRSQRWYKSPFRTDAVLLSDRVILAEL